jgi:hypothetical protein
MQKLCTSTFCRHESIKKHKDIILDGVMGMEVTVSQSRLFSQLGQWVFLSSSSVTRPNFKLLEVKEAPKLETRERPLLLDPKNTIFISFG